MTQRYLIPGWVCFRSVAIPDSLATDGIAAYFVYCCNFIRDRHGNFTTFFDILVYVSMAFFILLFFDTDHWGVPDVVFVASVCNRFAALGFNAVVA